MCHVQSRKVEAIPVAPGLERIRARMGAVRQGLFSAMTAMSGSSDELGVSNALRAAGRHQLSRDAWEVVTLIERALDEASDLMRRMD